MEEDIQSVDDILAEISVEKSAVDVLLSFESGEKTGSKSENIFEDKEHKSWKQDTDLARCDLKHIWKITPRAGVLFISIYKKSLMGKLLTDIKADDSMIPHFAVEVSEAITQVLGDNLHDAGWALVTAPRRRHLERNFATLICLQMAERLHIKFYEDILHCSSKHRVGAVFTISEMPEEPNIIVFDDIVTTGSTLASIKKAFEEAAAKKNMVFFAGINNKL